jgi:hypothetical protein
MTNLPPLSVDPWLRHLDPDDPPRSTVHRYFPELGRTSAVCPACDGPTRRRSPGALTCRSGCTTEEVHDARVRVHRQYIARRVDTAHRDQINAARYSLVRASLLAQIAAMFDPWELDGTKYNEPRVEKCGKGSLLMYRAGHIGEVRDMCKSAPHCPTCSRYRVGGANVEGKRMADHAWWRLYEAMGADLFAGDGPIYWQPIRTAAPGTELRNFAERAGTRWDNDGAGRFRLRTQDGITHFFTEADASHPAKNEHPSWPLHRDDARRFFLEELLVPLHIVRKPSSPGTGWELPPGKDDDEDEDETPPASYMGDVSDRRMAPELVARCNALFQAWLPPDLDPESDRAKAHMRRIIAAEDAAMKDEARKKKRRHAEAKKRGTPAPT